MVSSSGSVSLHSSLEFLQPSDMSKGEKLAPKKLKIKLSKLSSESQIYSKEVSTNASGNNYSDGDTVVSQLDGLKARFSSNNGTSGKEKRIPNIIKLQKHIGDRHADREMVISEKYNVQIPISRAKRGPEMRLENQKTKKQKIDSRVMPQCVALLKKLMTQPYSWVFNQPVDPVALCIPDYFSIISEPMDLGTIKSKLEKKLYSSTEEFAADVRLTFSNAMIYNPPSNDVHKMAKELKGIFETRWKTLDAKWSAECSAVGQQPIPAERPMKTLDLKQDGHRTQASCPKVSNKMLISLVQRQKLRKDLEEIRKRKIPTPLLDLLRKANLNCQHDRIEVDIDTADEITLCKLQKVIRSYHQLSSVESQSSCGRDSLQKDLHKGNGRSTAKVSGSASDKSQTSSAFINASCESLNSRFSHHNDIPSDVDSDRTSVRDINNACHLGVSNLEHIYNDSDSRQKIKSDPDSDGAVSVVDENNAGPSSHPLTPCTAAASEEGWENNAYDAQLSPSKALRAAMLMTRFADTIVKARQKALLGNGEKTDPLKMKQEKERLEKQQREEKARIEAKIRAAEAASRRKEEMEIKKQREKEREAARLALQKMERTVEIYENMEILKDIEMFGGYSSPDYSLLNESNPLERLGLFMKDRYLEDDDDLENCNADVEPKTCNVEVQEGEAAKGGNCNGDVEEGEIPF